MTPMTYLSLYLYYLSPNPGLHLIINGKYSSEHEILKILSSSHISQHIIYCIIRQILAPDIPHQLEAHIVNSVQMQYLQYKMYLAVYIRYLLER